MLDFDSFYDDLHDTELQRWIPAFQQALQQHFFDCQHGDLNHWLQWIESYPPVKTDIVDYDSGVISIGTGNELSEEEKIQFEAALKQFMPWRKGPFNILGIPIDTEWRSDMKWDRLANEIAPLEDKTVLDVGCGSGYHCWRMLGAGARLVVGIDPSQFFMMQYLTVKHFLQTPPAFHFLPLTLDQLPQPIKGFDSVFSMGVLYHRRSPIDHLMELKHSLCKGGELILETLVVDGEDGYSLVPQSTYGKMRNVWFIPSCATLVSWLQRCGFINVRVVDKATTTIQEQRKTPWIQGQSLEDFLDPKDSSRTVEGHPAPVRAVVLCNAP